MKKTDWTDVEGRCACGHSELLHEGYAPGNHGGPCSVQGCQCKNSERGKYTWVGWMPGHEPKIIDEPGE